MTYPARSVIVWRRQDGSGDTAEEVLGAVLERLRALNANDGGARELSLSIQKVEEAQHWLGAFTRRTGRSA